jgi:hypothetical protein
VLCVLPDEVTGFLHCAGPNESFAPP